MHSDGEKQKGKEKNKIMLLLHTTSCFPNERDKT